MIPKEHELVVLLKPVPGQQLEAGDVGTIVHVYPENAAFEVEFVALDGHTTAVVTIPLSDVRPVTPRDMMHTRERRSA